MMGKELIDKITQQYMEDYIDNKNAILKKFQEDERKMLELCACSGIPVIAAYGFVYELTGDPEHYESLKRNVEFYYG
jgi:hypothetical protein